MHTVNRVFIDDLFPISLEPFFVKEEKKVEFQSSEVTRRT